MTRTNRLFMSCCCLALILGMVLVFGSLSAVASDPDEGSIIAAGTNTCIRGLDPFTGAAPVISSQVRWCPFAWSPDRTWILCETGHCLYRVDVGTGTATLINNAREWWYADLSWDGTRIVASAATRELYVMNSDGSGLTIIATGPDASFWEPRWSPDGTKIAYHSGPDGATEIWLMNADGTGAIQLTNRVNGEQSCHAAWSPDGSKIAFSTTPGLGAPPGQIWVMNADGSGQQQLTSFPTNNALPTWSPSGTKIAFRHGDTHWADANQVWVMNADGSNPHWVWTCPPEERSGIFGDETGLLAWSRPARAGYVFVGFLPPINMPPQPMSVFKRGSTIPVKFRLLDSATGAPVGDASARIRIERVADGVPSGVNEPVYSTQPDGGDSFRYDPEAGQYIFNLSTKSLSLGTYRIHAAISGDPTDYWVDVAIR